LNFPFLTSNAFFWWFAALAIPIVIHLLNRRRHRTVQWAAMAFLLKATRESRGKKKLKHIIILTCRALAIAALVFAVARPLVSNLLGWGGGKLNTIILVLDRSASMEQSIETNGFSKRETVIKRVQQSMAELGNPRLILVDSATGKPQEISSPSILNDLSTTTATDSNADIPSLINTAINQILEGQTGRTEIWVASDMQKADWNTESGSWGSVKAGFENLPQKATLRILSLDSEDNSNISIRIHSARRLQNELIIDFELTRLDSSLSTSIPVTFSINGVQSTENYDLENQSTRTIKNLKIDANSENGYGSLSIPSDANPRDNYGYFAYGKTPPSSTAIIADSNAASKYLSLASAPPGYALQTSKVYTSNQLKEIPWGQISLLLWQAPIPNADEQKPLLDFLDQGGAIVFFPSSKPSTHSFLDTSFGDIEQSPSGKYFIVENWDQSDGPLRNGIEGTKLPINKLKAIQRRTIKGEATSLAFWDDQQAFISRAIHNSGTVIFTSTTPDYTWSNLAEADFILPIAQRMLEKGNNRFGAAYSAEVGSRQTTQILPNETITRLDNTPESPSNNSAHTAGVWKIGERIVATNRPTSEDDLTVTSEEELNAILQDTPYQLFTDTGNSDESFAQEIWQAFLIAMLVFLITEAILCLNPKRKKELQPSPNSIT